MQCHLVARHYICELCNAILLQGIIYVNYAMSCCLDKRHICELYHDVLFLYFSLLLSTMFVYSTALPVHQPFELVMEKSGVKKQGLQSRQCYLLKQISCWLQIALQRRIQRQMTSPIIPLRCMLKLGRVILLISCICCIAMLSFYIIYTILNAISLVDTSYMRLPSAHFLSI